MKEILIMFGELMKWNPIEELSNWHRDIDDLFGRSSNAREFRWELGTWMETYRKDSDYVVRVDLPGVDPNDVHVQAEGNLLIITGNERAKRRARIPGNFLRQVRTAIAFATGCRGGEDYRPL